MSSQEDKIIVKLEAMDQKIDLFSAKTESRLDQQLLKIIEIEEKMDFFLTKDEFRAFKEQTALGFDQQLVILRRLDQGAAVYQSKTRPN